VGCKKLDELLVRMSSTGICDSVERIPGGYGNQLAYPVVLGLKKIPIFLKEVINFFLFKVVIILEPFQSFPHRFQSFDSIPNPLHIVGRLT